MQGKILNDRFELRSIIGRGSTGTVWHAYDNLLLRDVAIKFVQVSAGLNYYEARMMARVNHPNIMPILDLLDEQDELAIVMPFVGDDLKKLYAQAKDRPIIDVVRTLQRIAEGIDHLHANNIVHCDIRPKSILIDEDDQPYITNFGLAKDFHLDDIAKIESMITADKVALKMAMAYAAPEVLEGRQNEAASDIFAFGLVAYELFTGVYPFNRESIPTLLRARRTEELPSIRLYRPEMSLGLAQDIDAVLVKLTERQPQERYATAMDAVNDLFHIAFSDQHFIDGRIFISYSRQDQAYVRDLADTLQRFDVDVWYDKILVYGAEWDTQIDMQLNECDIVLVIATPDAMASDYVTYEWSYFKGANKPVFPFVPAFALNDLDFLHPRLRRVQFIRGTGTITSDARRIIEVISEQINQHTETA